MYKKILIGIDNSEHALKAIDKVIELQKKDNSEVVLFHSILHKLYDIKPAFGVNFDAAGNFMYEIHEDRIKASQKLMKEVEDKFKKAGLTVETRLTYDIGPQYYIEKQVEKEGFDLVVLGCQGEHSKLRRTILGTVPEYVLNHVDTDVLVIK